MLLVLRAGAQHLLGDLRIELGLAGADHVVHADLRVRVGRVALADVDRPLAHARVRVSERLPLDAAGVGGEVHRAPVGDLRDHHVRDLHEQLVQVERGGEHGAASCQEPLGELHPLLRRDVLDHVDRHRHLAAAIADRGGLDGRPALLARVPHAEPDDGLGVVLATERAPPRERLEREVAALLVEDLEAVDDRGGGGVQELLVGLEAERPHRGVVGEQEPPVGGLRGHGVGHAAQDRLELAAGLLALLLRPEPLDELAELAAERLGQLVDRGIALADLAGEHLDDADEVVAGVHGERHAAVQPRRLGLGGPVEASGRHGVAEPGRAARLPDLAGQPVAGLEGELGAAARKGVRLEAVLVPARDAAEHAVVLVHGPVLGHLAAEGAGDHGEHAHDGLVEVVRVADDPRHLVLSLEPGGVALPVGPEAGHDHREHAPRDEHGERDDVPVAAECVAAGDHRDRHHDREGRHEHVLPHGRAGRGDQRAHEQKLNEQRERVDREVDHHNHRHREQRQCQQAPFPGRVPRIQLRAQPGRGYSARTSGCARCARARRQSLRPDARRDEHVCGRGVGGGSGACLVVSPCCGAAGRRRPH